MIRYALHCDRDHAFEAWFRSSDDYDKSVAKGLATCPVCGSAKVEKALMAPALKGAKKKDVVAVASAPDPRQQALVTALRELRKQVTENADYVGDRFAEEARKIHYEEVEPHGIYGEASLDEAKELAEEGIAFQPLPTLPEDGN